MLAAIHAIGWFVLLIIAIGLVGESGRISALTKMFPEGYKFRYTFFRYLSLAVFAAVVLNHPFK